MTVALGPVRRSGDVSIYRASETGWGTQTVLRLESGVSWFGQLFQTIDGIRRMSHPWPSNGSFYNRLPVYVGASERVQTNLSSTTYSYVLPIYYCFILSTDLLSLLDIY